MDVFFFYVGTVSGVDTDVNIHKFYVRRSILRSENAGVAAIAF